MKLTVCIGTRMNVSSLMQDIQRVQESVKGKEGRDKLLLGERNKEQVIHERVHQVAKVAHMCCHDHKDLCQDLQSH